jgi:DNA-binding transcriptional ArsR family regulator
MDKKTGEQAAFFKILSDPTRLELVKLLCRQPKAGALCVNALAFHLGISQSAVSQHLRVLKYMGLVEGERRGYRVHYVINPEAIKRGRNLISSILEIEES